MEGVYMVESEQKKGVNFVEIVKLKVYSFVEGNML